MGADATRFRGVAARCNYLAFDRPDIQYTTKEVCREMSKPTVGSLRRLRRIGQYLKRRPRLVWNFEMQEWCGLLDRYTDSSWAGCRKSRKSTSGGTVMMGRHCIKTWSKTQAIIAKSSAEAELYGVIRGATEGLGLITLLKDFGKSVEIRLHVDAAAAKGIIERKGLSKVRHLDVNVLWLQETAARKNIPIDKIPGEDNPADLTTKHLATKKIAQFLDTMNMTYEEGRAGRAAKLHSIGRTKQGGDCDYKVNLDKAMSSLDRTGDAWNAIRRAGNYMRGGDRWTSRGSQGIWHRWHVTPRKSLFTPHRVAKGPGRDVVLQGSRFTCGVTSSGQRFEMHDNWTRPDRKHLVLDAPWVGYTVFIEESVENVDVQAMRKEATVNARQRWMDVEV